MSKVFIEETTLTAIGDAIREKTGKSDLIAPGVMPDEIRAIETGGGGDTEGLYYIPDDAFYITGDASRKFYGGAMDWFVNYHGDKITTERLSNISNMFYNCKTITNIPFDINCGTLSTYSLASMFESCYLLENVPKINGKPKPSEISTMFRECQTLRNLPEGIEDWFDWSLIDNGSYTGGAKLGANIFNGCYSLRSVPMGFLSHDNPTYNYNFYCMYYGLFQNCYVLDEVIGLPIPKPDRADWSSNYFGNTFNYCSRLKNMTFATNEDGSPIQVKWKNQTIDLSMYVGFTLSDEYITNYNSGITTDKRVNANTGNYDIMKNDPDWYSNVDAYSRYDHDSAVRTINSLPDTTISGGTNTIKFKGNAGYYTDAGAINTLTAEEIAVATAKGWTVSLV